MVVTEIKRFVLTDALRNPVEVEFLSRKGSIEQILFTRFYDPSLKTQPDLYWSGNSQKVTKVDSTSRVTYNSQWLTADEFEWLKDLFLSPYVTIDGKYVRVIENTYEYDSLNRLFVVQLTVAPQYEENKITF